MLKFIFGLIVGGVGVWLIKSKLDSSAAADGNDKGLANPNTEAIEQKARNLEKIMDMASERGEIANDDVERGLGVSDATATRYLEELEAEGKLEQIGERGKQVYYRIKG